MLSCNVDIGDIASLLSSVVGIGVLFLGFMGFFLAKNQMKASRLNALLLLEQDMWQRSTEFSKIYKENGDGNDQSLNEKHLAFESALEGYLNSVERLSSCVINSHFDQKEMRSDYKKIIDNVVSKFPEKFDAASNYRKIKKLKEMWED